MDQITEFIRHHWALGAVMGALSATIGGWFLTYRGWKHAHQNNLELERQKYRNNIEVERRKAELNFVSEQIKSLYGPLFALGQASSAAFRSFCKRYADGRQLDILIFNASTNRTEGTRLWRLWMGNVIMPINTKMEDIITSNSHLISGSAMPQSFVEFLAHVETYKAVIKNWENVPLDTVEKMNPEIYVDLHTSILDFPESFHGDVERTFAALKRRQEALLVAAGSAQVEDKGRS
jgi:hypothetical protein